MPGIEELLSQEIEKQVSSKVAVVAKRFEVLRPWISTEVVKEYIGVKDSQWVINHFAIGKNKKTTEAYNRGLVKKVAGQWRFKNPEFMQYLHDDFWNE
ncbi:hypothetical protein FC70_GL000496 [Paucilactobacillus oligofermentans DSM 15707 = LMG 22743]|uniref:Uncharacterized protein n=1 Tax=Paucilactobacillus oligofermentans DSM 15707 = LMG 22743 TaxID=1423778 RepID=A0A0R1RGA6_9LACO|nr:hypothetical protein [Paucilactobacillus oligofermentans]KRL55911.1 hypothetical protein FC70_GL000496 [Paucilactobacillus oligofermentans DSM 15707 = LMG 22743]CUS26109.1 Uncharacterized protein LACOL_0801 [Paucilactobacillus oligofermentans DSM 15707 = LMG 22743]